MSRHLMLLAAASMILLAAPAGAAEKCDLPCVFEDDFEKGADRWQPTDPAAWRIAETDGGKVYNHVHDEEVFKEAKEKGVTRSMVAIEKACYDENTKIFAIGNAPTALFVLMDLIKQGKVKPELIIGVPIGFAQWIALRRAASISILWVLSISAGLLMGLELIPILGGIWGFADDESL